MCSFCDIQNAAPVNIFSDDEIERIVVGVYSGLITPQSLDLVTYQKVAEKLTNGVYNGFGKTLTDVAWNSPDYTMLNSLRNNVYVFSGAKQYHQVREMVDAIYDKDRIKPFSEYKKTGTDIFKNYNENYLRAEYNAAISQSRSASMWMDIENNKELLPMLEYVTVGDGRVRPEHAMLDRIKRPVDDKFWNNYFPPNGWNCRCTTLQSDDTDKTSLKGFTQPKTVPPEFMMNAGKDKIVFSDKHPYFKVAKQDENLAANNFNMPKPRMEMPKMPEPIPTEKIAKTLEQAEKNQLDFDKTLTEKEQWAVVNYTGRDYVEVNNYLRGKAGYSDLKDNKQFIEAIDTLSSVIDKSPKFETTVYRGISFDNEDMYNKFINQFKNPLFVEKSFLSTTADKTVLNKFTTGEYNVILEIESKKGALINKMSAFETEKEVIFNKGSKFKIKETIKDNLGNVTFKLSEL